MSEGAVRDDMTLKMTAERVSCGSNDLPIAKPQASTGDFHTPDFGLTAIFNLPYFTRH